MPRIAGGKSACTISAREFTALLARILSRAAGFDAYIISVI
jgi:hypothetical protein